MGRISYRGLGSRVVIAAAVAVAVGGCDSSDGDVVRDLVDVPVLSKYDMANRCFVLKANGAYAVRNGAGFVASGSDAAGAERFYMKPAGLGRYLFYTSDRA